MYTRPTTRWWCLCGLLQASELSDIEQRLDVLADGIAESAAVGTYMSRSTDATDVYVQGRRRFHTYTSVPPPPPNSC